MILHLHIWSHKFLLLHLPQTCPNASHLKYSLSVDVKLVDQLRTSDREGVKVLLKIIEE